MNNIRKLRKDLENSRIDYQRSFMREYNKNIYLPALRKLQEECEKIGHNFDSLNSEYYFCQYCGKSM